MSKDLVPKLPIGCKKFTPKELERLRTRRLVDSIEFYSDNNLDTVEDWLYHFRRIKKDFLAPLENGTGNERRPGESEILTTDLDGEPYEGPDRINIWAQRDETDAEYSKRLNTLANRKKANLKQKLKRRREKQANV